MFHVGRCTYVLLLQMPHLNADRLSLLGTTSSVDA